jgi:2-hydroxy-3-keto-5-methylthiopentenyl-1-phosphate phosphatase
MATTPPLRVLLDFDGTLVGPNVAMLLVETFCPDGARVAREVDEALHAGAISLREAWDREVALLPADRIEEMRQFVVREVPLREGARDLASLFGRHAVDVTVLSGGLDFFIRPVLEREGLPYPVLSEHLVVGPRTLGIEYPHGHPVCRLCGICKANAVVGASGAQARTVFIGDGSTDRYGAEVADVVFARRRLQEYCRRQGIPFLPFENFEPVTERFTAWLERGEPVPERTTLGLPTSPCPVSRQLASGPAGP